MWTEQYHAFFSNWLSDKLSISITVESMCSISGGSISQVFELKTNRGSFLVKSGEMAMHANYAAELDGLKFLRARTELKVPDGIGLCQYKDKAFLILEFLTPRQKCNDFWDQLAFGISSLHRHSSSNYGYQRANFIGSLPQSNREHQSLVDFFWKERIVSMLEIGTYPTEVLRMLDSLFPKLADLLPEEPPSAVHGDLWSGNFIVDGQGKPALIDPAVAWSHREFDIAFSKLFGGFEDAFYDRYNYHYPLVPGWQDRVSLFNIYPLMVHFNIFGAAYLQDLKSAIKLYL